MISSTKNIFDTPENIFHCRYCDKLTLYSEQEGIVPEFTYRYEEGESKTYKIVLRTCMSCYSMYNYHIEIPGISFVNVELTIDLSLFDCF